MRNIILYTSRIDWILFLSCVIRALQLDRTEIVFEITNNYQFQVKIKLPSFDKNSKKVIDSFFGGVRKNAINISAPCENYQRGQAIFYEQGSSLFGPWIWCPALSALEKASNLPFTVPAGVSHSQDSCTKHINMSMIERDIRQLVYTVNKVKDLRTVYSCHGHRTFTVMSSPFVRFFAKKIDSVIFLAKTVYPLNLHYQWKIRGRVFNYCPVLSPHIIWELALANRFFLRRRVKKDITHISYKISGRGEDD